jgi:hypothetical protein
MEFHIEHTQAARKSSATFNHSRMLLHRSLIVKLEIFEVLIVLPVGLNPRCTEFRSLSLIVNTGNLGSNLMGFPSFHMNSRLGYV